MDAVELQKMRAIAIQFISRELADHIVNNPTVEVLEDTLGGIRDAILVRVGVPVAGRVIDRQEVKYPASWKDAVKARFSPGWVKRRWPVKYTVVTMTARELYPKLSMPDRHPTIGMNTTYRWPTDFDEEDL